MQVHTGPENAVTQAFKKLLNEKHLYQCVKLDLDWFEPLIHEYFVQDVRPPGSSQSRVTKEQLREHAIDALQVLWIPQEDVTPGPPPLPMYRIEEIPFGLPTIHVFCQKCASLWPFNPFGVTESNYVSDGKFVQWFCLAYRCQSCKGTPIKFLVRREGIKLWLVGRDPIEIAPTPKELPEGISKFFGDALIAHNAGQTLAGIFLLRVFVEQFWRSLPEIKSQTLPVGRQTGDELGAAYNQTLPPDFKARFPSLPAIYSKLSEAMHSATADPNVFETTKVDIEKHFQARVIFGLP